MIRSLALSSLAVVLVALPTRAELIQISNSVTNNLRSGRVVIPSGDTVSYSGSTNGFGSLGYDPQLNYAYSANSLTFSETSTGISMAAINSSTAYNQLGGSTSAFSRALAFRTTRFQVDQDGSYDVQGGVNASATIVSQDTNSHQTAMTQLLDVTNSTWITLFQYQQEWTFSGFTTTGAPLPSQVFLQVDHTYAITVYANSYTSPSSLQSSDGSTNASVSIAPSAVPEPASLAMLALGLGGTGVVVARRRSR